MTKLVSVISGLALALVSSTASADLPVVGSIWAGEGSSLSLSPDGSTAYVGHTGTIYRLNVDTDSPALLSTIRVAASALDSVEAEGSLWIAGGSLGLFRADVSGADVEAERVVLDPKRRYCLSIASAGGRVFALFAGLDDNVLRIYDARSAALEQEVPLADGIGWDVAASTGAAFVALGAGGVAAIDATSGVVTAGPPLIDSTGAPAIARSLITAGPRLYVAADTAGLVAIDWASFGPSAPTSVHLETTSDGSNLFPHQLASVGTQLAVLYEPSALGGWFEGAPYTSYGIMTYGLDVGEHVAHPLENAPASTKARFTTYDTSGGLTRIAGGDVRGIGVRGMALTSDRLLSVVTGPQAGEPVMQLRSVAPQLPLVGGYSGAGKAPVAFVASSVGPWAYAGVDSAGASEPGGVYDLNDPTQPSTVQGTEADKLFLLLDGASVLVDTEGVEREWIVTGGGGEGQLRAVASGYNTADPSDVVRYSFLVPAGSDGFTGRNYLQSLVAGDEVYLTRFGTRTGLLVYQLSAIVAASAGFDSGAQIDVAPVAEVDTHFAPEVKGSTWKVDLATLPDGRRVLAVAAGSFAAGSADPEENAAAAAPRLELFEVSDGGAPVLLASIDGVDELGAPLEEGNAVAVRIAIVKQRAYAVVTDFGGRLLVFDVTDPSAPSQVALWSAPAGLLDGHYENLFDVALAPVDRTALEEGTGGALYALVSATRIGVLRLDLTDPSEPQLVDLTDTPGLPTGITLWQPESDLDPRILLVAEHNAGLTLLEVPSAQSSPGEGGAGGAGGGSGDGGAGASSSEGGSGGDAPSGGAGADASTDEGCSCKIGSHGGRGGLGILLGAVAVLLVAARRCSAASARSVPGGFPIPPHDS